MSPRYLTLASLVSLAVSVAIITWRSCPRSGWCS